MVEQRTAARHGRAREADEVMRRVGHLPVRGDTPRAVSAAPRASHSRVVPMLRTVGRGRAPRLVADAREVF